MIPACQNYSHLHVKLQAESGNHCGSKSKSMTPRTTRSASAKSICQHKRRGPVAIFSLFLALVNQRQFRGANEFRVAFYVGDRTVVSIIEEP
jgi:hypothetical protein